MILPISIIRYARQRGKAIAEQARNNLPNDATQVNIVEQALAEEPEARDTFPCTHYLAVINEMDNAEAAFEEFLEEIEAGIYEYATEQDC